MKRKLESMEDLLQAVEYYGFLPFFPNDIPGFSVEEMCAPAYWFAEDRDGPWEWKGPAAQTKRCAYGKFFRKKAGFVSREWLPELVNFRRDGYDFDARCDDGLVFHKDEELYNTVNAEGEILSKFLKKKLDYRKGGNTGFETCITRLQMQTYLCVSDFIRLKDKNGRPYTTPEHLFGYDYVTSAYKSEPKDSEEK